MKLLGKVSSPLVVILPRKTKADKRFILNLNVYRNTYYIVLNQAKSLYSEVMEEQIKALPEMDKIKVTFTVYPKTRRLTDIPNVCIIHDKFFMDALVHDGKLVDDNYKYHCESTYKFGEVDKENPRVDIEIYET